MTFCRECPFREPRLHNFLLVIPGNSSRGLSRLSCLSFTKTKIFRSCKHVIMNYMLSKIVVTSGAVKAAQKSGGGNLPWGTS